MAKAKDAGKNVGGKFKYQHPEGHGFGQHHAGAPLPAEMRELDLASGEEVTLLSFDVDSHSPIVEWVDGNGLGRITTVDPAFFNDNFLAV